MVAFPFDVVAGGLLYQEGIAEVVNVILDGIARQGRFLLALERVGQLVRIGQRADARCHDVDEFLQVIVLAYPVTVFDVL